LSYLVGKRDPGQTESEDTAMMRVSAVFLLILLSARAEARKEVVIIGKPLVRVVSTPEGSHREILTESQQHEFQLLITKDDTDNSYVWESREKGKLIGFQSGAYTHFAGEGIGWIKVGDVKLIKAMADEAASAGLLTTMSVDEFKKALLDKNYIPDSVSDSDYVYFEVVTQGMLVGVYWGVTEEFSP